MRRARPPGRRDRERTPATLDARSHVDAGDPAARELLAGCDAVLHFAGVPDPARARRRPGRAPCARTPARRVNLLEGCLEHGAGLDLPVDRARRARAAARRLRALEAPRRGGLPPPHGARDRRAPDVGVRARPGRLGGRDGRDRRVRRARARGRADRDPAATRSARATSSTSTTSWPRSSAIVAEGRWGETLTLASGIPTPLLARGRAGAGRGRLRRRRSRRPGGELAAGRERELRGRRGAAAARLRPPARSRRRSRSMSTGSAAIPLLKAAPEPDQVADRLDGGAWRGLELCLAAGHVARRRGARARRSRSAASVAATPASRVTAEAPVALAERRVRARRPARRRGARGHRAQRRVRGRRSARPVLTIHLFVPMTPAEFRARGAARRGGGRASSCASTPTPAPARGVTPLIENVPAGAAHAHRRRLPLAGRRPLARPARLARARARARLHARHLARGAVPLLRRRLPDRCSGSPPTTGSSSSATSRSSGPAPRSRTSPTPHGLLGEGLAVRQPASSTSTRSCARLGELVPLHRRRDQRARPRALAGHEGGLPRDRARARGAGAEARLRRGRAPAARPTTFDWQAVLGRRDPVPVGARAAGALRRPARADHRRRRLDRRRAGDLAAARLPPRADHAARRPRGVADRRPPLARRARARAHRRTCSATSATPGRLPRRARARAARRRLPPRRLQARRLGRALPRGVRRHQPRTAAGTCCAPPSAAGVRARSWSPPPTRRRSPRASTGARSASWSSSPRTRRARAGAHRVAVRLVNVLGSAGSASELFLRQARAGVPLTVTDTGMVRYWITMAHAATLLAHAALLAADGTRAGRVRPRMPRADRRRARRADLARRRARAASPALDLVGIRPGETMSEVLTGPGETAGPGAPSGRGADRGR